MNKQILLIFIGGFLIDIFFLFRDIPEKLQIIPILIIGIILFLYGLIKLR